MAKKTAQTKEPEMMDAEVEMFDEHFVVTDEARGKIPRTPRQWQIGWFRYGTRGGERTAARHLSAALRRADIFVRALLGGRRGDREDAALALWLAEQLIVFPVMEKWHDYDAGNSDSQIVANDYLNTVAAQYVDCDYIHRCDVAPGARFASLVQEGLALQAELERIAKRHLEPEAQSTGTPEQLLEDRASFGNSGEAE